MVYLGARGHKPMTEGARSRKELCRPDREGDREVRSGRQATGLHSSLRNSLGDFQSHARVRWDWGRES